MSDAETTLEAALNGIAMTYWLERDERGILPAIVYQRISTAPRRSHSKANRDKIRFQISVYGTTSNSVSTVANSIVTTLEGGGGFSFLPTKENRFDIKEQQPNLFRTVLEFFVWN